VETLPEGVTTLVSSAPCPVQMVRTGRNVYATQFHPEANGETFATRIRIYNGYGYFEPDDAARLTEAALAEDITVPEQILARFVTRYG
jgi:GMP synthase (glutamine-hydrolysing)